MEDHLITAKKLLHKASRLIRIVVPSNPIGNGEAGSSLLWVLIISAFTSVSFVLFSGKMDRFNDYRTALRSNLFIQESLSNFNNLGLQCPGGVIRISKGSCRPKTGIKLSLRQIRRLISLNNLSSFSSGGSANLQSGLKVFGATEFFVTRMLCYKQGNPELQTSDFYKPCTALKNIILTPLVGQSLLKATAEGYLDDVSTIETRILSEISDKMTETRKRQNALQSQLDPLYRNLRQLQASCSRHVPTKKFPVCGEAGAISSVSSSIYALNSKIAYEQSILQNYNAMTSYLQGAALGKTSIISNSQLAVLQENGGLVKVILRQGLEEAGKTALKLLPPNTIKSRENTVAPPLEADTFPFGMLDVQPFCQMDGGHPVLRLRASLVQGGVKFGKVGEEQSIRKKMVAKALEGFGRNQLGGFTTMPSNFVPSGCKLLEEEDPPTTGKHNWTSDYLSSTR